MTTKTNPPCPICGSPRKRDSSRHLLATCGSYDCSRASSAQKQLGVSKLPDQFKRTIAFHACFEVAPYHWTCCPSWRDESVDQYAPCDHMHNGYCSGVDDRSEWKAREEDGLNVDERIDGVEPKEGSNAYRELHGLPDPDLSDVKITIHRLGQAPIHTTFGQSAKETA